VAEEAEFAAEVKEKKFESQNQKQEQEQEYQKLVAMRV
jgi:hypothetical protein